MMYHSVKSPKLRAFYTFIIFFLIVFTLFRLAFLAFFKSDIAAGSQDALIESFMLGFRFDLRLTIVLLFPSLLLVNLPFNDSVKTKLFNGFYTLIIFALTFLYILDAGYFSYLKTRLNATALQFLQNPIISFDMVKESYPWPVLFLMLFVVTGILAFIFDKVVTSKILVKKRISSRRSKFFKGLIFFFVMALGIYGSVKKYPLRWSEAFHTTDNLASNLALNPILYVADTYSFRHAEYDKEEADKYYSVVADFLKIDESDRYNQNLIRSYEGDAEKAALRPNVVIVIMESLGWYKTGIGGSEINPTPNFDKLSQESILFTNFYTPTIATARSVFAAITSLPDTSKTKTSSRNPFYVNQHTIISEFEGYDKFYFLGGSANWGNIRGVLSNNIPNLNIFEEGSYNSPIVDVWGISDLNLFKESSAAIKSNYEKTKNPFFAIVQTAGFHRPYTIPKDSDEFKVLTSAEISEAKVKEYGFDSLEEYNAMRLQDYALSRFMEIMKKEAWFDNTVFVIFGDHSLPHNNAVNVPNWKRGLPNNYHVPLLIHWPKQFGPRVETKIASELDVLSTIAGIAGVPYKSRAFGRDLFNEKYDDYRAAFSYNLNAPYNISLIDSDFYFEYIPEQNIGKLLKYSESLEDTDVKDQYPEKYEEMEKLTKGLYETSRYLLNNNPKIND